ncbi:MAG TPA: copper resistance protein CopC [Thermomicrobiales bacterium]
MRIWHSSRGFLITLLSMMLIMASVGTVTAANPPEFIASEPPSGAVVAAPPTQIILTFSQPTDPSMTGGYVHNVDGIIVSTAIAVSPDDPTKVIVTLTPGLASGWYMVMWNTALVGSDNYITGDLTFDIA